MIGRDLAAEDEDLRRGEGRFGEDLTPRERFDRIMHYQHVDYISHLEFGVWEDLMEDWLREGLVPSSFRQPDGSIPHHLVLGYFGAEEFRFSSFNARLGPWPLRPREVIEETDTTITYRDGMGVVLQEQTQDSLTIPHFLEFPVRDRKTWESFRDEFLDPDHPARAIPEEELRQREQLTRTTDNPTCTTFGSFIGWIRNWTGFERLAYMSKDDPDLVEKMVAHLSHMLIELLPPVLARGRFDAAWGWEDICFNSGPILSPRFFAERIVPHMKPVIRMLRQYGIDVIWTDCDGNILDLIPLWMDAGINCMFPLEVHAGNDPVALKKEYGRDLLIRGGFDKMVLYEGREAILEELLRIEPAVARGGFIPHIDHYWPQGVPFDTYRYYIWEKCHMLGWPEHEIKEFPALRGWQP